MRLSFPIEELYALLLWHRWVTQRQMWLIEVVKLSMESSERYDASLVLPVTFG